MKTTHLSSRRHVTIPKTICDAYHLAIGQELEIELTPQGILLKPKTALSKKTVSDLIGCTGYQGDEKSLEEMEQAIEKGIIAEWGNNDCR